MQLDHEEVEWLVNQLERAAQTIELTQSESLVAMSVRLAAGRLKYKMGHKFVLIHDERTWGSTNLTVDKFLNKGKE